MVQTPYYAGNHPPPLFVAELDSEPGRPSDAPSHHRPDGTPVFEMSGEPVLPQHDQDGNQSSLSNQWPSSLQAPGVSKPTQQGEEHQNKPSKDPSTASQSVMANPWAYFGPESSDDKFIETQRPQTDSHRPSEPVYRPYPGDSDASPPEVTHGTRPSTNPSSPDLKNDDHTFYPAPLKLAHRPANATSPPAFKAYVPPVSQDSSDLEPKLSGRPDRTDSQSPTALNAYRPYRPHSPQPPASSVPTSSTHPAAASHTQIAPPASPSNIPQQQPPGTVANQVNSTIPPSQPPNPPASGATLPKPAASLPTSPRPQTQQPESQPQLQYGIPNAAPAQPMPPSASTYLPSPVTPSGQLSSVVSPPATPATNAGVPFTQPQYAAHVAVQTYAQTPTSLVDSPSSVASLGPSYHAGVPFTPQYAIPVQAHNFGLTHSNTAAAQASASVMSSSASNSSQSTPVQFNYSVQQPTYSTPVEPAQSTLNQASPPPPTPYQQAIIAGPKVQQTHAQQSNTGPYSTPAPTVIPQSPPPPYAAQDTSFGAGAQPPGPGNSMMYQPSPTGPCPPQPHYSTQSSYAPAASPPLPSHLGNSLQPPALPPRPSSSQGFAPTSGFGAGPAGYNPASYPRPPQTYFAPPPALPPRPGLGKLAGGGGKLFGSSSADKWLKKTGQVLESTLAPYLQGQSGQSASFRPGSNGLQGQQGQPMQQAPGQYPSQGHHFHVPHLAPQYRGASESGHPPQGPSTPGY
ncbi:uncharacterized protein BKA55DRAFT_247282 [Fusarium redolens]|uniref:Uncharacterized protein n=1 Tax=Fusarium redolens TaxID=48865 RepID=A0A9P9KPT2_FUSRE|nr:uncharacterized protein BKA55DRAFT_247282 [Fusarium redolens]KAH7265334.1 hypothetical protein BKA55DRAFT_247282 [Fusarium redolens]